MDKMMSLFEYLGKPAGEHLGKEVYIASKLKNVESSQRQVSNPKYTGMVMTYPESFLKEYFDHKNSKPKKDLPF